MAPSGLYARLCHAFSISARSANLPEGLYIFFYFFITMSKAISVSTEPIFTIFYPGERYLREFSRSGPVFPMPQGTLPWQSILWQIVAKLPTPFTYHSVIPKRNGISPCEYTHS